MTEKCGLPQGTLDLLILRVVELGTMHGYAIARRLGEVSNHVIQVSPGSLYPALHRLQSRGYLAGERKKITFLKAGKAYRLTPMGQARLKSGIAGWTRLSRAIGAVFGIEDDAK